MSYRNALFKLVQDESGQDLVEYALVSLLIAFGAVASMKGLAVSVSSMLASIGSRITSAV